MSAIPFTDLAAMSQEIWPAIEADYMACLLNADFVAGPPIEIFERDFRLDDGHLNHDVAARSQRFREWIDQSLVAENS